MTTTTDTTTYLVALPALVAVCDSRCYVAGWNVTVTHPDGSETGYTVIPPEGVDMSWGGGLIETVDIDVANALYHEFLAGIHAFAAEIEPGPDGDEIDFRKL